MTWSLLTAQTVSLISYIAYVGVGTKDIQSLIWDNFALFLVWGLSRVLPTESWVQTFGGFIPVVLFASIWVRFLVEGVTENNSLFTRLFYLDDET